MFFSGLIIGIAIGAFVVFAVAAMLESDREQNIERPEYWARIRAKNGVADFPAPPSDW